MLFFFSSASIAFDTQTIETCFSETYKKLIMGWLHLARLHLHGLWIIKELHLGIYIYMQHLFSVDSLHKKTQCLSLFIFFLLCLSLSLSLSFHFPFLALKDWKQGHMNENEVAGRNQWEPEMRHWSIQQSYLWAHVELCYVVYHPWAL